MGVHWEFFSFSISCRCSGQKNVLRNASKLALKVCACLTNSPVFYLEKKQPKKWTMGATIFKVNNFKDAPMNQHLSTYFTHLSDSFLDIVRHWHTRHLMHTQIYRAECDFYMKNSKNHREDTKNTNFWRPVKKQLFRCRHLRSGVTTFGSKKKRFGNSGKVTVTALS